MNGREQEVEKNALSRDEHIKRMNREEKMRLVGRYVLFCGDAAMNGFPSRRRIIIWIEDLKQYRQSWERIIEAPPRILYPGHGKPFQTTDLKLLNLEGIRLYPLKHCSE